jgi:hypothetical protein
MTGENGADQILVGLSGNLIGLFLCPSSDYGYFRKLFQQRKHENFTWHKKWHSLNGICFKCPKDSWGISISSPNLLSAFMFYKKSPWFSYWV